MCYANPCQNSGTCHNTGAGQFMCLCPVLFRGITCDGRTRDTWSVIQISIIELLVLSF